MAAGATSTAPSAGAATGVCSSGGGGGMRGAFFSPVGAGLPAGAPPDGPPRWRERRPRSRGGALGSMPNLAAIWGTCIDTLVTAATSSSLGEAGIEAGSTLLCTGERARASSTVLQRLAPIWSVRAALAAVGQALGQVDGAGACPPWAGGS